MVREIQYGNTVGDLVAGHPDSMVGASGHVTLGGAAWLAFLLAIVITCVIQLILTMRYFPEKMWLARKGKQDRWLYRRDEPARYWANLLFKILILCIAMVLSGRAMINDVSWLAVSIR